MDEKESEKRLASITNKLCDVITQEIQDLKLDEEEVMASMLSVLTDFNFMIFTFFSTSEAQFIELNEIQHGILNKCCEQIDFFKVNKGKFNGSK